MREGRTKWRKQPNRQRCLVPRLPPAFRSLQYGKARPGNEARCGVHFKSNRKHNMNRHVSISPYSVLSCIQTTTTLVCKKRKRKAGDEAIPQLERNHFRQQNTGTARSTSSVTTAELLAYYSCRQLVQWEQKQCFRCTCSSNILLPEVYGCKHV